MIIQDLLLVWSLGPDHEWNPLYRPTRLIFDLSLTFVPPQNRRIPSSGQRLKIPHALLGGLGLLIHPESLGRLVGQDLAGSYLSFPTSPHSSRECGDGMLSLLTYRGCSLCS